LSKINEDDREFYKVFMDTSMTSVFDSLLTTLSEKDTEQA